MFLQLGVLCLAIAHARMRGLHARWIAIGGVLWLTAWAWPTLPLPPALFYITFGTLLLVLITLVLTGQPTWALSPRARATAFLAGLVFFAFATWEVCGLGSTGRMLHPEEAAQPIAHNLLVTQSTKLMLELVLGWSLLLLGASGLWLAPADSGQVDAAGGEGLRSGGAV